MKLQVYRDRDSLMQGLAEQLEAELAQEIGLRGRATFCVPGGTTPGPVFDRLAQADLDWAKVAVLLNDERWVGEDSPRSNTRLLRERLLTGRAAAAHLIPLYADYPQPEAALAGLAQGIEGHLPISVLLLGMGGDMHTASLFPGADHLAAALAPQAPVVMALRAEAAGEPRITLTARVLTAARHSHILITGAEKRAALDRALTLPPLLAPVRVVLDQSTVHWAE